MSLSSALSTALSGLTAATRAAEVVSSNVANAMTEGHSRRELSLSARTVGGVGTGVQVDGVVRVTNERTSADRRLAEASMENASSETSAWLRIETVTGLPTDDGSLESRINAFESALISAASRPDQDVRLTSAASAASDLAGHIRTMSEELQEMRMDADADIASMVSRLNDDLDKVQSLNIQIFEMANSGQDASALMDQRQLVVDAISEIVPVHQVFRDRGQIALYTTGGAILLDGTAGKFGFTQTGMITPDMTLAAGALSGLTLNGIALNVGSTFDPIGGGKLAAAFETRDEIATGAQSDLDAIARNLIERFQDPVLDPTLSVGDAALFTDVSGAFDPADEVGIAARIKLNGSIDPEFGGDTWRLRDGVGAVAVGDVGNASLLNAFVVRLTEERATASGMSSGLQKSVLDLASDFLSNVSSRRDSSEDRQTFEAARVNALRTEEARNGVDTDDEMQKLLTIEQAYAANARVMQTVDRLVDQLLEI